jgi:hypothetical protein
VFRTQPRIRSLKDGVIGALIVIAIGFAAYELFQFGFYRPQIVATGSITVTSKFLPGQRINAETRLAAVGRRSFWQVESSPGVWQDCGSDCAAVLRQHAFRE